VDKLKRKSEAETFARALYELAPAFGLALSEQLVQTLAKHYLLLLKWNRKIDLTSIVDPVEAAQFHYLESLYATKYLVPHGQTLVDIGSGAGFPGLPLAAFNPSLSFVFIESQARKVTFLRVVIHHLGLNNLSVFHGRFQEYKARDFDVVICRAIDRFAALLPDILRFGSDSQQILLFTGRELVGRCFALASNLWPAECFPIPLSNQRFVVSLFPVRST
jgi:16S rRNA (guanine527-N7)-methyltransferase